MVIGLFAFQVGREVIRAEAGGSVAWASPVLEVAAAPVPRWMWLLRERGVCRCSFSVSLLFCCLCAMWVGVGHVEVSF
jgi:hypothetical protein